MQLHIIQLQGKHYVQKRQPNAAGRISGIIGGKLNKGHRTKARNQKEQIHDIAVSQEIKCSLEQDEMLQNVELRVLNPRAISRRQQHVGHLPFQGIQKNT